MTVMQPRYRSPPTRPRTVPGRLDAQIGRFTANLRIKRGVAVRFARVVRPVTVDEQRVARSSQHNDAQTAWADISQPADTVGSCTDPTPIGGQTGLDGVGWATRLPQPSGAGDPRLPAFARFAGPWSARRCQPSRDARLHHLDRSIDIVEFHGPAAGTWRKDPVSHAHDEARCRRSTASSSTGTPAHRQHEPSSTWLACASAATSWRRPSTPPFGWDSRLRRRCNTACTASVGRAGGDAGCSTGC